VLVDEIKAAQSSLEEQNGRENWEDQWKKAFSNCFHKVDDEVGGVGEDNGASVEPLASEAVGSTAVVALLIQTHIIVANCGDSRAVLCRGKEAIPMSDDHKVRHSFQPQFAYISIAVFSIVLKSKLEFRLSHLHLKSMFNFCIGV